MKSISKHLAEIDETYYIERYDFKNSKARGIIEHLKETDQMTWCRK